MVGIAARETPPSSAAVGAGALPSCGPAARRPSRLVVTFTQLFTMLLAAGCSPVSELKPAEAAMVSVRDSAGITIHESKGGGWSDAEAWTITTAPTVTIGTTEGDSLVQLSRVVGAVGLVGSRSAVLNGGSSQLLIYDSTGALVRAIGRRGQGPGEFGRPQHLTKDSGDRLSVWDINFGPISTFDTLGQLLSTRVTDLGRLMAALGPGVRSEYLTPLPNGFYVAHVSKRVTPEPRTGTIVREPHGFVLVSDSLTASPLGWYRGLEFVRRRVENRIEVRLPLAPSSAVVVGGGTPTQVYVTDGDKFAIDIFDMTGRQRALIRRDVVVERVPDRVIDSARALILGSGRGGVRTRAIPLYDGAQYYPAIVSMRVDHAGFLWALGHDHEWSIFEPTGTYVGSLRIPMDRVHDIGNDFILGVTLDADGVERVVRYALDRGIRSR